ncbi:Ig-like domain-containing protein [Rubrolithibacter danxiaensis]|uniref:Ig-like domain-containing protein n=1 Tax=Rubrolithibacter danxiaensis TaxID=3390805 RepID=UPI003BF827B0
MKKILLFVAFISVMVTARAQTTLTFSSNDVTAWADGIAQDGEGGSADFPGATIQIFNISNSSGTALGVPIEWHNNTDLAAPGLDFSGLTTFLSPDPNQWWAGIEIKTQEGSSFDINGFRWYDWSYAGTNVNVIGYRNGSQVASQTFTANSDESLVTISLNSTFDVVDEVRITYADGTGWGSINDISIAGLPVSITSSNISCNGGSNGVATVIATGTSPYTYSWSPSGATSATITGLATGTYTATVTDANGLVGVASVTLTQPAALSATSSKTDVTAYNAGNGSISVTASGGTPGYTYSWAPLGGTSATASNLSPGTYTCTITDANSCTTTASATITQPAASSNANLSNLNISSGTLSPAFASATTSYTASVPNATTSVNIIPTVADATATVTVNGTATTSGSAKSISLITGVNSIPIIVTAQDGTIKTYTLTITRQFAPPGNSLAFAGSTEKVLLNAAGSTATDFGSSSSFTLEAWIKPSTFSGNPTIFSHKNSGNASAGYSLFLLATGQLYFECTSSSLSGSIAIKANQWTHVAVTFAKGAGTSGTATLYVNGEIAGNGTVTIPLSSVTAVIGNFPNVGYNQPFKGRLDELKIWNVVRTQAEIQAGMLSEVNPSSTNLVAYYNFDQGIAAGDNTGLTTLSDQTANHFDGTLNNFTLTGSSSNWMGSYALIAPTATAASAISYSGFKANWTVPTIPATINSYNVYVATDAAFGSQIPGSPFSATNVAGSLTISGLNPGTNYYYRVTATGSEGEGAYSNTITAKTLIPTVTSVAAPSGTFKVGDVFDVMVNYSDNVTVTGSPALEVTVGSTLKSAVYFQPGSSGNQVAFRYTVISGDLDNDGVTIGSISLNSGTIKAGTVDADNTLSVTSAASLLVDGISPTLAITSSASALKSGQTATITFTFSEDPGLSFSWDGSAGDITVSGGTLSAISGTGLTRTATFTPTANANGGTASITVASGSYMDAAGNTGGAGTTPSITFDTLDPAAPSAPDLAVSSDSGTSDTDNLTNNTTPTFSGTAEAGSTVRLYDTDGVTELGSATASGGTWSITSSTLSAGSHTITARATDAAGNTSAASSGLAVTIDTNSPTLAITSNGSTLKSGETAAITFTFSKDPGTTFSWDGSAGDIVVSGGTLSAISGSGLTRTATFTPTANTNGGTVNITVASGSYADAAGNVGGAGATPSITFDTLNPAAPSAPDLAGGSDSGTSGTDNITNNTTPAFNGTAEAGATVTLYDTDGTTVLGSGSATGGNWSITSSALSAGTHSLTAKAADAAGNVSAASAALSVIIDTSSPMLAITSSVSALKIAETASITFTFSEDPGTTFSWDGSVGDITVSGGALSAISGTGLTRTAVFTPDADTNGGTANITVASGSYADAAGNAGGAGTTPSLTFDTKAPAAPSAPDLATGSDSGSSNSDNITTDTTPTFTGTAETGATITLYDTDGTTVLGSGTATGGNWSITSSALSAGAHTVTAKATDAAGNVGVTSTALSITIDTSSPTLSTVAIASSNSTSTLAKVGDVVTVIFTSSEAIQTPTVTIAAQSATVSTTTGNNWTAVYTMTSSETAGNVPISISFTDISGTAGTSVTATTNSSSVIFDKTAPTLTTVTVASNNSTSTLAKTGDVITLSFTASETIQTPTVTIATHVVTATNGSGNSWTATYTLTATDIEGNIPFSVAFVDAAGNTGTNVTAANSNSVIFDKTAPALSAVTIVSNNSTATLAKAGDIATLTFTSSESIQAPVVAIAGHLVVATASANNWTATYTFVQGDTEGLVSYTISFDDLSGNAGTDVNSGSGSVTFDETTPITPTDLKAISGNTQIILNWTGNTEADLSAYRILYGTSPTPVTFLTDVAAGTTSYTHTGLINGTTYYYRILAVDKTGNTSVSSSDVTSIPKADQTITFNAITSKTYGDAAFTLGNASSSAGLMVTYTAADPSVVVISGNIATILKAGSTVITGSQSGSTAFNAAPDVLQTLNIDKKDLTVINNSRSKVYGEVLTDSDFSGSITGIVYGDNISLSRSSGGAEVTATTGTYPITATIINPDNKLSNYNLNISDGTLTVTPKALTVAANENSKTYGDRVVFAGTEFNSTGLINNDKISGVTLSSSGTIAEAAVAGSPYTIVPSAASGDGLGNYNITYVNSSLIVNKKVLSITADNKTRFIGTANPELTVSYDGFVNGDKASDLTLQPDISTLADKNSPPGNYPIEVNGAQSANYNFIYHNGTLTVRPGAPTSISLTATTLFENRPAGTLAGVLSSTSEDQGAVFTYKLVSGNGDTDNGQFLIENDKIKTRGSLNYEQKSNYHIRVQATTQYGFSLEKELIIALYNVNEVPALDIVDNQEICYTSDLRKITLSGITAGEDVGQNTVISVVSENPDFFKTLAIAGSELRYEVNEGASRSAAVTVIVKDNGGTANGGTDTFSRTFTITVNALPIVSISSDKGTDLPKGLEAQLTAAGGSSYEWFDAEGIVSGRNTSTLTVRPSKTTTYRVRVTNLSGCSQESQLTIYVKDDYSVLDINNIMTPNGDGVNDRLMIKNIDMYPNNEVKIFDRAGRLLYSKKNYGNEWDGTFQGAPLAEDTYYYVVNFGAGIGKIKGFVTIVRE